MKQDHLKPVPILITQEGNDDIRGTKKIAKQTIQQSILLGKRKHISFISFSIKEVKIHMFPKKHKLKYSYIQKRLSYLNPKRDD